MNVARCEHTYLEAKYSMIHSLKQSLKYLLVLPLVACRAMDTIGPCSDHSTFDGDEVLLNALQTDPGIEQTSRQGASEAILRAKKLIAPVQEAAS